MTPKDIFKKVLLDIGVIKEGDFTLSSGEKSDFYADFRLLVGYPRIMEFAKEVLGNELKSYISTKDYDLFCAIPYGGLCLGALLSNRFDIPLIFPRYKKNHGTQSEIEGVFKKGQRVIIIDDVVTTGNSCKKIIELLEEKYELEVLAVLSILNRKDMKEIKFFPISITLFTKTIPIYSVFNRSDFK